MSALPPEELERRVRELAEHAPREEFTWEALRAALDAAPREAPLLHPEDVRRAELGFLLSALLHEHRALAPVGEYPTRVGYLLESAPGSDTVHFRPAFAEALAAQKLVAELRALFPDLWAVDFSLWRELASPSATPRSLALAWLTSPGRRLVHELACLSQFLSERPLGATDGSLSRLASASGPAPSQAPAEHERPWHQLHSAIPGPALGSWRPASKRVIDVLQALEGRPGDPVFLRGAALAWLLDVAAHEPFYTLDGLQRDLREDIQPSIVTGFPAPEDTARHAQLRASARLEAVCLLHGARLSAGDTSPEAIQRAWSLGRWVQSCTFRSPYFGGDEEVLTARLRALLPASLEGIVREDEVLDPCRFGIDSEGLDLAELALVAGTAWHYSTPDTPKLLPTPLPLVNALRRVAGRTLRPAEIKAETCLARQRAAEGGDAAKRQGPRAGNGLGWGAPHIAPPLVARWVMTDQRIGWMRHVPSEVLLECLNLLEQQPFRHPWVAFALYAEGAKLPEDVRERAAAVWRSVLQQVRAREAESQREELLWKAGLTHMAAGVLDRLSDAEAQEAVDLARHARADWRHRVLEGLGEAAERLRRDVAWHAAVDGLLEVIHQDTLDAQERVRAALLALRRVSSRPLGHPDRATYLQKLADVASRPPFQQNIALKRELRRLGVSSLA